MAKPNILIVLPAVIPSAKIGVINPLNELKRKGFCEFRVLLESHINRFWGNDGALQRLLQSYDVIIMCRNQSALALNIAIEARRQWIPLIYDIDDNFFDIGLTSAIGRYHRDPLRLYQLEEIVKYSSKVRVYAKPMLPHMQRLEARYTLVDSYFDKRLVKGVRRQRHKGVVRIAYPTSRTNDDLAEIFVQAALKLFEKYGDKVEIHFWSNVPGPLRRFKGVKQHKPIANYETFIDSFYKMGFDIGLAPLKNTVFHRSKTNNKYREYSGCGVAGVYSNVDVYSDCVEHEQNGLLVENTPEQWFEALDRLVSDPALRKELTQNAAKTLDGRFSLDVTLKNWREQITESLTLVQDQKSFPKAPSRPITLRIIAPPETAESSVDLVVKPSSLIADIRTTLADGQSDKIDSDSSWSVQAPLERLQAERLHERRVVEFEQAGEALGAEVSNMRANPKDLALVNIAGIAVIVATNIDMVIMSLEMRTRALGLIVDTTPMQQSADLNMLESQIKEWSQSSEDTIFMVRDDLAIEASGNIIRVQQDSTEQVDSHFSAQARLYASIEAIDNLARKLSLPPATDHGIILTKVPKFYKSLRQRLRNLLLLIRGSN